jgi:(1->4)-alpha-D-glucan 1-alpha-D-glucosylmutase
LTAPGVPDIYQGTELSDLSLADPDNRRPVDYARCAEVVARVAGQAPEQVLRGGVGQAKPWLVGAVLALRRELPECFEGGYLPLVAVGTAARHVVAFARGGRVVSVVLRLTASLPEGWGETRVILPPGQLLNVLTGERVDDTRLSALLARCPVALLRSL